MFTNKQPKHKPGSALQKQMGWR